MGIVEVLFTIHIQPSSSNGDTDSDEGGESSRGSASDALISVDEGDPQLASTGPEAQQEHLHESSGDVSDNMWNRVLDDGTAFDEGGRGDTSVGQSSFGCRTDQCISRTVWRHTKRRTLFGSAWSLFGAVLLAHIAPNDAVMLPLIEGVTDSSPATIDASVCDMFADVGGFLHDFLHTGLPAGTVFWEDYDTLLDKAKGDDFYSTCAELALFLRDLEVSCMPKSKKRCVIALEQLVPDDSIRVQPGCEASAKLCLDSTLLDEFFGVFCIQNVCMCWRDIAGVPQNSHDALSQMSVWNRMDAFQAIQAYTDGSFFESSNKSGWAVLFLVRVDEQWKFAGFAAGCIQGTSFESGLRSIGFNAFTSEVAALMVALAYIGHDIGCTAEIVYDATSAADVVLGEAWPSSADSPVLVAKLLGRYVRQRVRCLCWQHVKSMTRCRSLKLAPTTTATQVQDYPL